LSSSDRDVLVLRLLGVSALPGDDPANRSTLALIDKLADAVRAERANTASANPPAEQPEAAHA
jgi:hypothetical protein